MREPSWTYLFEHVLSLYPGARTIDPVPMKGGASTRRFFRISLGDGQKTAVAMFTPGAPTHEIHKDGGHVGSPFVEVQELLRARGVRVPELYADGSEQGWLVVEDLGDDTIAHFLAKQPHQKRDVYRLAVRDLAGAQSNLGDLPEPCIVKKRAFDRDLLRWELDHFWEWGVAARDIAFSPADRAIFDPIADRLAARIAGWPRGFVHRDYQSRNLMVIAAGGGVAGANASGGGSAGAYASGGGVAGANASGGEAAAFELAWIDFQDALLGPRVYDLVALLSDSYQEFEPAFIDERLDEYASHRGLGHEDRALLGKEFDWVTVQRKLKDAGRFIFIDRAHKNPGFLPFVEPTIQKARRAMARLADDEDMRALSSLLDRVLPS